MSTTTTTPRSGAPVRSGTTPAAVPHSSRPNLDGVHGLSLTLWVAVAAVVLVPIGAILALAAG